MMRSCALADLALAVSVTVATAPNTAKAASQNGHAHHLKKAEKHLHEAQAALSGQNLKQAHKDVAEAIHQLEEAIEHHHKHHIASQGQTNGTNNTKHHTHHELLKRVVSELRDAEKELKGGSAAQASKEIEKAEKTLKSAIESHHHLFGKQ